jgi:hypothetical protein
MDQRQPQANELPVSYGSGWRKPWDRSPRRIRPVSWRFTFAVSAPSRAPSRRVGELQPGPTADLDVIHFAQRGLHGYVAMLAAYIRLDFGAFCLGVAETVVSVTHVDLSTASWDRTVDGAIEYQRGRSIPERRASHTCRGHWAQKALPRSGKSNCPGALRTVHGRRAGEREAKVPRTQCTRCGSSESQGSFPGTPIPLVIRKVVNRSLCS